MKKQLLIVFFLLSIVAISQENKPFYRGKISSVEYVSPIISRTADLVPFVDVPKEAKDKRSMGNVIIPGQDPQKQDDFFRRNRHPMEQSRKMANAGLVFDTYSSSSQPTDPSLAVGPNHVMVVFNTGFMIYDKQGNELLGETAPNPAIFPSGGCCDLTVSYDNAADRWVLSFLGGGAQIAVSDGPNPLTSGWYIYNISQINDYQKLSIWSDGYYLTDNTSSSNRVWALERDAMLQGDTNAGILGFNLPNIRTSGFYSPQVLNVTDNNLPATGGATVVYMQDNAWSGVSTDHVKVWTIDVDWNNTSASTVSNPQEIPVTPFIGVFDGGSFSNLPQPNGGATIDALQATIMNQAQFRKFATHNSAVFNFVVDTDASSGKLAGVRWMEFRQTGDNQPWSLYQEGTYNAPDGRHAWNASLAMDASGNIGMGYTSLSGPTTTTTTRVSSYFTGRSNGDPLGTMTAAEGLIANGNQNIPGTRYGDYSKIDVDPSNNSTFWYITEYMNNGRKGVIGTFEMQPAGPPDTEAPTNPSNLTVSNITSSGATLNWTAATDNVAVARYLISINGNQVGTSSNTSFDVTGLTPNTQYTAAVVAQDAAGNNSGSVSVVFTTVNGPLPYCDSTGNNVSDEFISNVTLNTINNNSGAQGYSDFSSISTNLSEGQSYTITITPTWTGTVYNEGYAVWIDYNNNGDFDDSGELVWSKSPSSDATNSGSFTIPNGTAQTSVRMRVSMKYNAIPTSCETFTYGEVEDYTVNLEAGNGGGGSSGVIAGFSFETGLEGWSDPGSDCARVNTSARSYDGNFSVRLRDDTSTSNTVSPELDLSGNNEVTFEFFAFINSFESGENFLVEFFNGSSYQVIGQYTVGVDYNNEEFFTDIITLDAANFNFTTANRFRLRCDASGNADRVYFDQITISGDNVRTPFVPDTKSENTPREELLDFTNNSLKNIKLYPNPAVNSLNIEILNGSFSQVTIYSITGQIVYTSDKEISEKTTIDTSQFATGSYFVKFVSDGKAVTKRFIKK
ncbi:GEVED domain-containing protein [uncultured Tenacibaculum sp.]|uniref:GEVED domain-containing protein n=1 Tax=uncultured Tenacibaculum sp. TaxID=174713 RepID=UPI00262D37CE|nr:GEVED domain-containing protein [uncultured Tenacibaculum sp.]